MKRAADNPFPQGPRHYWKIMVQLSRRGGVFTVRDVLDRTSLRKRSTIKTYIAYCEKIGAIKRTTFDVGPTIFKSSTEFRVVNRRMTAPVQRRANYQGERGRRWRQLWTAMRALKSFTILELCFAASTQEIKVEPRTARAYVAALAKVGYVAETSIRARIGEQAAWKLRPAMSTGPQPPAVTRDGVYDRNLKRIVTASDNRRAA